MKANGSMPLSLAAARTFNHLNAARKAVHLIFDRSTLNTHSILRRDSAAE
jgi:hypothetical protein